ncbi:MAG TPA: hypothetical protein VGO65_10185 [Pseudolysinimonas sp.]|nr:hypothetical protein [Pseudolysinimonas sp.]
MSVVEEPPADLPAGTGRRSGFSLILTSTVVAGLAGYAITFLVYRVIGTVAYATFAIFWSALYLAVGGLSGIQQEITRGTRQAVGSGPRPASVARTFGVIAAVAVAVLVGATSPLWGPAAFGNGWSSLVAPIAVGAACYVLVTAIVGSLYGVEAWRSIAWMLSLDAVIRLALLGAGLLFTHSVPVLAWLAVVPFPLTVLVLWPFIRRHLVGRTVFDVGYRALTGNVLRTLVASVSTGVLVSGFPLLVGLVTAGGQAALVGELVFTITLVRAPLIVGVMSLQSFLVVVFRDRVHWVRTLLVVGALLLAGGGGLALVAVWIGPPVLEVVGGRPGVLDGGFIGLLVVSSAGVAALSVTAAAALARSRHTLYGGGWAAAAAVTVLMLMLPLPLLDRVALALLAGPLAGLLVHVVALLFTGRFAVERGRDRSSSS